MNRSEKIMSIRNLSKTYHGNGHIVKALNKVSFQLAQGEMLAVMGTSGSGKSTLLNILGALDSPTSGEILLHGIKLGNMFIEPHATRFRRENIGFIFQSFHLLKDLSVEENIALPLALEGESYKEISLRTKEMLHKIGLAKWSAHRPVSLSGGQQQRVAIGRALITSPPILLADEPTGNLDFNTSKDIMNLLVEMKQQNDQSIIIVTHDPMVSSYADRVLFFHDGEIVDTYTCNHMDEDMDQILLKFKMILRKPND